MDILSLFDRESLKVHRACEMLASFKWQDGFNCKKCKGSEYYSGKKPFSRKCSRCKHVESVTANTAFNKLKIPLEAALYLVHRLMSDVGVVPIVQYQEALWEEYNIKVSLKAITSTFQRIFSAIAMTPELSKQNVTVFIYKHRHARIIGFLSDLNSTLLYATTVRSTKYEREIDEVIKSVGIKSISRPIDFKETLFGVDGVITAKKNLKNYYTGENLKALGKIAEIEKYLRGRHTLDNNYSIGSKGKNNIQPHLNFFCLKEQGMGVADLMIRLTKDYRQSQD